MTDTNTKKRKKMIKEMSGRDELNFIQALIMLIIVFILFTVIFPLIQRAVDIQALHNCEAYGDCSEVIRDINANK